MFRMMEDFAAFTSLAHFPNMSSVAVAIRHTPLPVRAMPSHMAEEAEEPIPSVNTRNRALLDADFTFVDTRASVASMLCVLRDIIKIYSAEWG